jgi:adenylate cyclase
MQRRLSAILSADVADYSGLMEADEAGTLTRLKRNRSDVFDPCVAAHGGRLVKLMGDGALVEFASVTAAVNCALAIQEGTARAEPDAAAQPIRYRIGINLGDVIVDGDDIYGEGVNVAARLQAIAPVGGIALSATVRDHVDGKVRCAFDDHGSHTVKNIQRPVHVFLARSADAAVTAAPAAEARPAVSVCVLPFTNMSGDPEQEYFSDGITEDIITDLSKVSALWVTARNTAFTFKGKHVDVPQLARQLKVSHVLEGSVRKSGARVRITAQLIDGATGGHVWAERYDRDLADIFALQDEISEAIVASLRLKLLPEEKQAIERRGTGNPEAWKLYQMARQFSVTGNVGSIRRTELIIRLCERATELDPGYAQAWALKAGAEDSLVIFHAREGDGGAAAAARALALDPGLAEAHAAMARTHSRKGRHDEALAEVGIALSLDPDSYETNNAAAHCHFVLRHFADAIAYWERSGALEEGSYATSGMLVSCYRAVGDHEGALRAARVSLARAEKIVAQEPDNGSAISHAVGALATLGEFERAKEWMERALLLDPNNLNMRYNFACTLVLEVHDHEAALDMLEPTMDQVLEATLDWVRIDPDLDAIRDHPRFAAMLARADLRLARAAAGKADAARSNASDANPGAAGRTSA